MHILEMQLHYSPHDWVIINLVKIQFSEYTLILCVAQEEEQLSANWKVGCWLNTCWSVLGQDAEPHIFSDKSIGVWMQVMESIV